MNRHFRHLPHAHGEFHDAAGKANDLALHRLASSTERTYRNGFAHIHTLVHLFVDVATNERRGLVSERYDRSEARHLFTVMNIHRTHDPAFLGNLSQFFLLLLEFFEFLLQVFDFALASVLLQAVAAAQKLDLFVGVGVSNGKFILKALNLHGHCVVTVAIGIGALKALELCSNFLVLLVFGFKSVDFGLERKSLGGEVGLDCGNLLVDVCGREVATAFASVKFASHFGNTEREVRTVEFHDGVTGINGLARHHVHLHHFGRARQADCCFGSFCNSLEGCNLALVHVAKNNGDNHTENPSQRKLVTINVSNAGVRLVRIPKIFEHIAKLVHTASLHFRRGVLHHELHIRDAFDLRKLAQNFGSGVCGAQANLVGHIEAGTAIDFAHGNQNKCLEARLHNIFDLTANLGFVGESKAKHTVKEMLGTKTGTRKEEGHSAKGNRATHGSAPGVHTATDTGAQRGEHEHNVARVLKARSKADHRKSTHHTETAAHVITDGLHHCSSNHCTQHNCLHEVSGIRQTEEGLFVGPGNHRGKDKCEDQGVRQRNESGIGGAGLDG